MVAITNPTTMYFYNFYLPRGETSTLLWTWWRSRCLVGLLANFMLKDGGGLKRMSVAKIFVSRMCEGC